MQPSMKLEYSRNWIVLAQFHFSTNFKNVGLNDWFIVIVIFESKDDFEEF